MSMPRETTDNTNDSMPPKRTQAAALRRAGVSVAEIAERLHIARNTVYTWFRKDGLMDATPGDSLRDMLDEFDERIRYLVNKEGKTEFDLRELEVLGRERRKYTLTEAKQAVYIRQSDGTRAYVSSSADIEVADKDFNSALKKRGRKSNDVKNHLTPEQVDAVEAAFLAEMYDYQRIWYDNIHQRVRNILKSRQIGATFHFAREAIVDALRNGRNKVFLSASKAQALIFRDYIVAFVYRVTGVELKGGDKITMHDKTRLLFSSTSANTAQGYSGDVYGDEYFWIPKFAKFRKVTSAMAAQKRWRITMFSSPSSTGSEAYPYWTGEHINRGRAEKDKLLIDVSHAALKRGRLCEDGQWRIIITVYDAQELGCDLFDIEQLKREYPPDEFRNLFECQFVDDANSVFKFEQMMACGVEISKWLDFDPTAGRPYAGRVWIGYDPAISIDAAACVVVAVPENARAKFRVLEKHLWYGESFGYQASMIRALCEKYRVEEVVMDKNGLGHGVSEEVKRFFPRLTMLTSSEESKNAMITKARDVIRNKRLEFDIAWTDVMKAFLLIYLVQSESGRMVYKARRTADSGHADLAFALMYVLMLEGMAGEEAYATTYVKIINR